MANITQTIEKMQASFPHIYNVYDKKTILYALLSVFGEKYGMRTDIIDRLYAMIGIDSTYDEDLEHRWGSLLNIYKQYGESYDEYRNRLKIVYSSLSGGTAEAIKYAMASAVGINSPDIDNYVHVYDAWKYPYEIDASLLGIDEIVDETSLYGSIICTIDLAGIDNNTIDHSKIVNAVNQTKASGINPYLLLLYNANEHTSLPRNHDTLSDTIKLEVYENAAFSEISDIADDFVDVTYMENELCNINMTFDSIHDQVSTQTAHESVSISTATGNSSKVMQRTNESILIDSNIDDSTREIMTQTIHESGTINNTSDIWGSFGTNSAILNKSLVTNMYAESDECVDVIIRSAILGDTAILGQMILGVVI